MENKTAVQELLDIVEMDGNNEVEISMKVFHGMLKKALEKERKQIEDAYMAAVCDIYELEVCPPDEQDAANSFYAETYKSII